MPEKTVPCPVEPIKIAPLWVEPTKTVPFQFGGVGFHFEPPRTVHNKTVSFRVGPIKTMPCRFGPFKTVPY